MDWLKRMNSVIDYIEDNLISEISYEEMAKIVLCSMHHFQRMFSFITGIPLSEYIRRRRLTLAAIELQNTNNKVIDIAYKYGYESPEAFSRAFQSLHGITPTSARSKGVQLKAYPRLSFHILIKGDEEMNYKIVATSRTQICGKSIGIVYGENQYNEVKEFVDICIQDGTAQKLYDYAGYGSFEEEKNQVITGDRSDNPIGGIFAMYGHDGKSFRFMAAAECPNKEAPEEFELLEIPQTEWAVFSMKGKENSDEELDTITNIWMRLGEWFQITEYEHNPNVPEIEKRFKTNDGYLAEVWIPIVRK